MDAMTLVIDVAKLGLGEACRRASVAASAPFFRTGGTRILAVVPRDRPADVAALVRAGVDPDGVLLGPVDWAAVLAVGRGESPRGV